jgi:hypothetical protein
VVAEVQEVLHVRKKQVLGRCNNSAPLVLLMGYDNRCHHAAVLVIENVAVVHK